MNYYINIIFTVILILGLIIIFRKREADEELLFIKLAGYYLLGSFRFNLNRLSIPLGFIIYAAFLHPKSNARSKRYAALLGLIFFVLGTSIPYINNYLFERPRKVPASAKNINKIDLQRDWQLIKEKLEIDDNTKLEGFNMDYKSDGDINELRYELITNKEGGLVHYSVYLRPGNVEYRILPSKIDQWVQYNRLVTAERFFQAFSLLNFEEIRPKGSYAWSVLSSSGEIFDYTVMNNDNFLIVSENNIKKITGDDLPIQGFYFSSYGMVMTEKTADRTSYEGMDYANYYFDLTKN